MPTKVRIPGIRKPSASTLKTKAPKAGNPTGKVPTTKVPKGEAPKQNAPKQKAPKAAPHETGRQSAVPGKPSKPA